MEELLSATQMVDDRVGRIIQNALQEAAETCELDPEMCAASRILAKDFETFRVAANTNLYEAEEFTRRVFDGAADIDYTEVEQWQREITASTTGTTVTDNPFYDPGAVDDMPDPDDPGAMVRDRSRTTTMRGTSRSVGDGPTRRSWTTDVRRGR